MPERVVSPILPRPYPSDHHPRSQYQPLGPESDMLVSKELLELDSQWSIFDLISANSPIRYGDLLCEISHGLALISAVWLPFLQDYFPSSPIYRCDKDNLYVPS